VEQSRIYERGTAADHLLIHGGRSYERDLGTRFGKHSPERPRIQQPEQEADLTTHESIAVVTDRSDVHSDT
jgi:hypothetical protein